MTPMPTKVSLALLKVALEFSPGMKYMSCIEIVASMSQTTKLPSKQVTVVLTGSRTLRAALLPMVAV